MVREIPTSKALTKPPQTPDTIPEGDQLQPRHPLHFLDAIYRGRYASIPVEEKVASNGPRAVNRDAFVFGGVAHSY